MSSKVLNKACCCHTRLVLQHHTIVRIHLNERDPLQRKTLWFDCVSHHDFAEYFKHQLCLMLFLSVRKHWIFTKPITELFILLIYVSPHDPNNIEANFLNYFKIFKIFLSNSAWHHGLLHVHYSNMLYNICWWKNCSHWRYFCPSWWDKKNTSEGCCVKGAL